MIKLSKKVSQRKIRRWGRSPKQKKQKKGTGPFFQGLSLSVLILQKERDCPPS